MKPETDYNEGGIRRLALAVIDNAINDATSTEGLGVGRFDYAAHIAANWLETTGWDWLSVMQIEVDLRGVTQRINGTLGRRELAASLKDLQGEEENR